MRIEEDLSAAHIRLARVYIENLPYDVLIERRDNPESFFYIDPPYYGHETDYGKGIFCRGDFKKLSDLLKGIKGKFMLSLNDTEEVREIFKGFRIERVQTMYTAGAKRKVTELLIMNYKPPRRSVK